MERAVALVRKKTRSGSGRFRVVSPSLHDDLDQVNWHVTDK